MRLSDPLPEMPPDSVRAWPAPRLTTFGPVSVSRLPTSSPESDPDVVADVTMVEFASASVEPLSVNEAVLPAEPSFVNDSVSTLMVPMSLAFVGWVVPPNTRFQTPAVCGCELQFDASFQLPLPPPPVHVELPIGAAIATPHGSHATTASTAAVTDDHARVPTRRPTPGDGRRLMPLACGTVTCEMQCMVNCTKQEAWASGWPSPQHPLEPCVDCLVVRQDVPIVTPITSADACKQPPLLHLGSGRVKQPGGKTSDFPRTPQPAALPGPALAKPPRRGCMAPAGISRVSPRFPGLAVPGGRRPHRPLPEARAYG